ncbi:nickel-type superoxide dismutase maturation protease [Litoribacillus peritrichatus]
MIRVFKVEGTSMFPTLNQGDFVIASLWFRRLMPNQLVIVKHPIYGTLVKRIQSVQPNDGFTLCGDNPESVSSEKMGLVKRQQIIGKVIYSVQQTKQATGVR